MFLSLPAYAWAGIALAVTPLHIALMRWSMPTPKGKRSVSFIPAVAGSGLLLHALVKDYSFSVSLYLYTSVLLIFVIMIAPVRKWVAADIMRQEQNPDIKVKVHTPSFIWIVLSGLVTVTAVIGVWSSHT